MKVLTFRQVEENAQAGKNSTNLSETMAKLVPGYAGGEWSLFFANCQKPSVVSFDMRVEMYNTHNGQKDYLSVGEDMLPAVYLVRGNCLPGDIEPRVLQSPPVLACMTITKCSLLLWRGWPRHQRSK